MEIIGAFDAKARFSELLDRVSKGESFQITRHGRPVGKLVPPDYARDPQAVAAAVHRLKSLRAELKGMSRDGLIDLKHEGYRF